MKYEKRILRKGRETEEGRLKIKKIRKLNLEKGLCTVLKDSTLILSLLSFISGVYFLVGGLKEKHLLSDVSLLDYAIGIISLLVSFFAASELADISDDLKSINDEIFCYEEEILNSKKINK